MISFKQPLGCEAASSERAHSGCARGNVSRDRNVYILKVYNYPPKVYGMLTANERKVLRLLMASFGKHSINDVAKECALSPNGAYKILKKLEQAGILTHENVGTIKAYRIQFGNLQTQNYLEIALADERLNEPKIKVRFKDFEPLRKTCKALVLFGSYITEKKNPRDVDLLVIFEKDKLGEYKKALELAQETTPYKIHDVIQTPRDITDNLKKQNKIIPGIIRTGVVLWGHGVIVRSVEHAQA
jgi:DNA-binding Lrp family transcriptional regulator